MNSDLEIELKNFKVNKTPLKPARNASRLKATTLTTKPSVFTSRDHSPLSSRFSMTYSRNKCQLLK
jgi:hypothetical protein